MALSRRSLLAAITISLALPHLIGCEGKREPEPAAKPQPLAQETTATREELEAVLFKEFTFEIPGKWEPIASDRTKSRVFLLRGGNVWFQADGMIKVDSGPSRNSTPKELAESFLDGMDGKVDDQALMLDGVEAVSVRTTSGDFSKPRRVIMAVHDGKAYMIMAAAKGNVAVDADIDLICKTWKWK